MSRYRLGQTLSTAFLHNVHNVVKLLSAIRKNIITRVNSHALVLSNNNHLQPNQHLAPKAMVLVMATAKTMVAKVNSHVLVLSNNHHLQPN